MLPATQITARSGLFPVVQALTNLLSNMLLPLTAQLLLHALDCCAAFLMFTRVGYSSQQAAWQCVRLAAALATSSCVVEGVMYAGYARAARHTAGRPHSKLEASCTSSDSGLHQDAAAAGAQPHAATVTSAAAARSPSSSQAGERLPLPAAGGQRQGAGGEELCATSPTACVAQALGGLPDLDYVSPLRYVNISIKLSEPGLLPEHMPPDTLDLVRALVLGASCGQLLVTGGAMREGCVLLSLDVIDLGGPALVVAAAGGAPGAGGERPVPGDGDGGGGGDAQQVETAAEQAAGGSQSHAAVAEMLARSLHNSALVRLMAAQRGACKVAVQVDRNVVTSSSGAAPSAGDGEREAAGAGGARARAVSQPVVLPPARACPLQLLRVQPDVLEVVRPVELQLEGVASSGQRARVAGPDVRVDMSVCLRHPAACAVSVYRGAGTGTHEAAPDPAAWVDVQGATAPPALLALRAGRCYLPLELQRRVLLHSSSRGAADAAAAEETSELHLVVCVPPSVRASRPLVLELWAGGVLLGCSPALLLGMTTDYVPEAKKWVRDQAGSQAAELAGLAGRVPARCLVAYAHDLGAWHELRDAVQLHSAEHDVLMRRVAEGDRSSDLAAAYQASRARAYKFARDESSVARLVRSLTRFAVRHGLLSCAKELLGAHMDEAGMRLVGRRDLLAGDAAECAALAQAAAKSGHAAMQAYMSAVLGVPLGGQPPHQPERAARRTHAQQARTAAAVPDMAAPSVSLPQCTTATVQAPLPGSTPPAPPHDDCSHGDTQAATPCPANPGSTCGEAACGQTTTPATCTAMVTTSAPRCKGGAAATPCKGEPGQLGTAITRQARPTAWWLLRACVLGFQQPSTEAEYARGLAAKTHWCMAAHMMLSMTWLLASALPAAQLGTRDADTGYLAALLGLHVPMSAAAALLWLRGFRARRQALIEAAYPVWVASVALVGLLHTTQLLTYRHEVVAAVSSKATQVAAHSHLLLLVTTLMAPVSPTRFPGLCSCMSAHAAYLLVWLKAAGWALPRALHCSVGNCVALMVPRVAADCVMRVSFAQGRADM